VIEVPITARDLGQFASLVGEGPVREAKERALEVNSRLRGVTVWNINSTSRGGGVAELLATVLAYARGIGINSRWLVIEGPSEFFQITKRVHHALHGVPGDGRPLDETARGIYVDTLAQNAAALADLVQPGDVVILHDPQTAGLVPELYRIGARVVWRCHIGSEVRNEETHRAWRFLLPFLAHAEGIVFSRRAYVPEELSGREIGIIAPTIDPFAVKNQPLSDDTVRAILVHIGVVEGPPGPGSCEFLRADGTPGRVDRRAEILRLGRAPTFDVPIVLQISRWDPLKDPLGLLEGFARTAARVPNRPVQFVIAGPSVTAVADDPEGERVFDTVFHAWHALPQHRRQWIQLVTLPMRDVDENAAMVNALQRHASVIVQKSLAEGFGLTVTEAMWKKKPVVATAAGGMVDQIVDGQSGLLLHDPRDLDAFAGLLERLLGDPTLCLELGEQAHARVAEHYLGFASIRGYAELIGRFAPFALPVSEPAAEPSGQWT
jgi:trehalose synthase